MDVDHITSAVASDDPALGLRAAVALRRLASGWRPIRFFVARRRGWSWQQIGDALGVTRQSVHAKHGQDPDE